VENRKHRDDNARNPERWLDGQSDHEAEHNSGGRYASLHAREGHGDNAERSAECHHERKDHWQELYCRCPEEGAPAANRDHCHNVVPAKNWVAEAAKKATGYADPCVSERWA
jgi:hypothetical protein